MIFRYAYDAAAAYHADDYALFAFAADAAAAELRRAMPFHYYCRHMRFHTPPLMLRAMPACHAAAYATAAPYCFDVYARRYDTPACRCVDALIRCRCYYIIDGMPPMLRHCFIAATPCAMLRRCFIDASIRVDGMIFAFRAFIIFQLRYALIVTLPLLMIAREQVEIAPLRVYAATALKIPMLSALRYLLIAALMLIMAMPCRYIVIFMIYGFTIMMPRKYADAYFIHDVVYATLTFSFDSAAFFTFHCYADTPVFR